VVDDQFTELGDLVLDAGSDGVIVGAHVPQTVGISSEIDEQSAITLGGLFAERLSETLEEEAEHGDGLFDEVTDWTLWFRSIVLEEMGDYGLEMFQQDWEQRRVEFRPERIFDTLAHT